jgi:membrane-associated phospholipid phosphatase
MNTKITYTDASLDRGIRATCLTLLGAYLMLTIGFSSSVNNWYFIALKILGAGIGIRLIYSLVNIVPVKIVKMIMITGLMLWLSGFFYQIAGELQDTIVSGWKDEQLLRLEYAIFGTETSLVLQRFVSPIVTEGMMFAYVVYVPLLPLIGYICYRKGGVNATRHYFFVLMLAYVGCNLGFILFPVASQMYHRPEFYTVPLDGGFFTWCTEWMRNNVHYPGGSFPSAHCAAATVMLGMSYRYARKVFFVILPTMILLYISTVYGRFHYIWDMIAGIMLGIAVIKYHPVILRSIEYLTARYDNLFRMFSDPESVKE